MKGILYSGLNEEQINIIRKISDEFNVHSYKNDQPLEEDVGLVIIGNNDRHAISKIQKISRSNPELGIISLPADPAEVNTFKAAVQFTPFVGQYVKIIPSLFDLGIPELLIEEARLTQVRKKFRKTSKQSQNQLIELLKNDHPMTVQFLDKFLAQAPIGVVLLDNDHKVLDVNQYAEEFLPGLSKASLKYFKELFPANEDVIRNFLKESEDSSGNNVILAIDQNEAKPKYGRFFKSNIASASASYTLVLILDVTNEVEAEMINEEYRLKLESHNQELEQFAFIVTHDLKNPLTTINLSCEMAEDATEVEKDNYFTIIQKSADNLLSMLEGLEKLIDVRTATGQKVEELQFDTVLNNVLNEYQFQIKNQNITIKRDFSLVQKICYIKSYLVSIMHNMISNAIKYSREDEPLVLTMETSAEDGYTLLKISDNGMGINLDSDGENLFKPFRRLTKKAEGKGLGLSLIKRMIEKNNGKIKVTSQPGEGTTFYCYLCAYKL